MGLKAFISYSMKDARLAEEVALSLRETGVSAYVAGEDIAPGANIFDEISSHIVAADFVVVILTENVAESQWVNQEIGFAFAANKHVIPLVDIGVRIKGFLEGRALILFDSCDPDSIESAKDRLREWVISQQKARGFLESFRPHLRAVLKKRKALPFLGAGFSRNAAVPPGITMPTWDDLGLALSFEDRIYSADPIEQASAYEDEFGRPRLIRQLRASLHIDNTDVRPGRVHTLFCRMQFPVVITTNYDDLLEKACLAEGISYDAIVAPDQLTTHSEDVQMESVNAEFAQTRFFKIHGDFHYPALMVVTRRDYDACRTERQTLFAEVIHFFNSGLTPIFIGYRFKDPDLRGIWETIENELGSMRNRAYALLVSPESGDIDWFEQSGIQPVVLDSRGRSTEEVFHDLFTELLRDGI